MSFGRATLIDLDSRSLARAFSLLCLAIWAAAAHSQTFGRFGYAASPSVPGWKLTTAGFQADSPVADVFQFPVAAAWKAAETTAQGQVLKMPDAGPGGPTLLKCDLWSPGFSLYFPSGIDLKLASTGAPFLSWPQGSVGQTVPTPATPWILISFRSEEPPVLMSFVDPPAPMEIEGESGEWHLKSEAPFNGWVRFLLPLGEDNVAPATAAGLGSLTQQVAENSALWTGPGPTLVDTHVADDDSAVTVTWTFDKPGALVPGAALLAGFGGDPLSVTSSIAQLPEPTSQGPVAVTREPKLVIRFPIRPWPGCRYLALGEAASTQESGVAGVVDSAFGVLASSADSAALSAAGAELMQFLSSSHGDPEPLTNQNLPYGADGTNYDLAAANALLTQSLSIANGTPDLQNPLLSEVFARVDAYSWMPAKMGDDRARRGAALAAVAFAMREDPNQRLIGAMLQAGLSAERGLDLWRYWRGDITVLPKRLEPLDGFRRNLFVLKGGRVEDQLFDLVTSPVRVCGPLPVSLTNVSGKTMLTWTNLDAKPGELNLSSELAIKFGAAQNLSTYKAEHKGLDWTIRFTPKDAGACALELILPPGAQAPPAGVPPYSESSR